MVATEDIGSVQVLRVNAVRLDSAVGTLIRNAVVSHLESKKKFALDISNVKLVDSGGLGALVALLKSITANQGKLIVVGMNKPVRMMFELSRMDRQFVLVDDLNAALASLEQA
ncbi:MAG TPA: STAS domain-containing protein [Limnobacter sp.]|nr:STAS domain-containing protein [Limnobacter sp.]